MTHYYRHLEVTLCVFDFESVRKYIVNKFIMAEVIEKDEVAQAGDDDEQEALQSRHRKEKKELQGFST